MQIQVLVAAMNQKDMSLYHRMKIKTSALIGNQCECNRVDKEIINGNKVVCFSFNEKGVGLNRNNTLLRADGDICCFADEDTVYVDGYKDVIEKAFTKKKKADGIIFNIYTIGEDVGRRINSKIKRVRWYNVLNYGTVRLAVKNNSIKKQSICFNTLFGGGSKYSFGEDTLFMKEMLKKGLKIYTYPAYIATVDQRESTWFKGYNEKYFFDKGALYCALSERWCVLYILQDIIRHKKMYGNFTFGQIYKYMKNGVNGFKKDMTFREINVNGSNSDFEL